MKIILICSQCGSPMFSVNRETVSFQLSKNSKKEVSSDKIWGLCSNPHCEIAYESKSQFFTLRDLCKPVFFKDTHDTTPICYCSDLTRGEIKNAVKLGFTTIDSIQEFTHKDITGLCEERNPMGMCCRNVFLYEIENSKNL